MYRLCSLIMLMVSPSLCVGSDLAANFDVAFARWKSAAIQDYVFTYQESGAVLIVPYCAGAKIRVTVKHGVGSAPIVIRGTNKCPAGTRGRSIDLEVPKTIDEAFQAVRRYIFEAPTPVEVTVSYDPSYGFPLKYYVTKLELSDSDEGFEISKFSVLQ
jgi:hypothetical protein